MKYISEKEKKLENALKKLKKLDLKNDQITGDIKELVDQKNQLEIEKNELEKKYKNLSDEHGNLQVKIKQMMVEKIGHLKSGANCAWVPSPTAASLHSLHYHQIDIFNEQKKILSRKKAKLDDL